MQGAQVIGYTLNADADVADIAVLRASQVKSRSAGTEFHLESPFGSAQVKTQLVGAFNVSNALAVLGALLVIGLIFGVIQAATQINDPAVGFLPRLAAGLLVVLLAGNWIMERLSKYVVLAFQRIAGGQ